MGKPLETIFMNAKRHVKRGEYDAARQLYEGVLLQFPKNARAHQGLAQLQQNSDAPARPRTAGDPPAHVADLLLALCNNGRQEEAIAKGKELLETFPGSALLHDTIGRIYHAGQQSEQAALHFREAATLQPENAEAHFNLAVALQKLGRAGEAITSYREAIARQPTYHPPYNNLGALYQALGEYDLAIATLQNAIKLKPDWADAYINLGNSFHELGQHDKAISYYNQALTFQPNHTRAHFNMGLTLSVQGKKPEAIMSLERAIVHDPNNGEAHKALGNVLLDFELREEAILSYGRAVAARPEDSIAWSLMLHQQAHICDWEATEREAARVRAIGVEGAPIPPWRMLATEDSPARHRIRSERYTASIVKKRERPAFAPPAARPEKLRIGYFTSDIYHHATMFLLRRMVELHDRDRFEIHAFSYGEKDSSAYHPLFDAFHDVQKMQDGEVAALARKTGIDIAIDLKGHTRDVRLGIFAHGAAPVQIAYLGYPGTSGADFIDYMIADRIVVPPEQRAHYSESILYLPDCYQANDNHRALSERPISRAEMNLPEDAFVFACFNNSYKITPEEYDIWMRLLHKVDGSVLWLLKTNPWAETNLRREAEKRGIAPSRIVFAAPIGVDLHLARQQLADLFLDTFNVNAHTTASDALWGGLPVLTRMGQGFAARVAASLLQAIGLPELITTTSADYEALALDLATHPEKLADLRGRLSANRLTTPLFDTERFVRHIETGYDKAYDRFLKGLAPADLSVE